MTRERAQYGLPPEREPAPVVTEEGAWGRIPPPYRPPEQSSGAGPVWWVGALLVLTGAVWLAALSMSQLSSREMAMPAIERGVAALTEIDALLEIHEQELCTLAESETAVEALGFPVRGVDLSLNDVRCEDGELNREELRALLLMRSAERVYLDGAGAFEDESAVDGDTSILSPSGAIRATLDSVGASMHDRVTTVAWVLGAVNAVLLAAVLLLGRGIRRFAGVGLVLALAAFPTLAAALALWVGIGLMDSDSGLTAEFAEITQALLGLPLRNALILGGAGLALLVPVLITDHLIRRSRREQWWEYSR
jgi:hypothetical protein